MLDPNKIAMEAQLQNLRKELEPMFLMLPTIAEMNFKYYKALLDQGFTEVQALEMTKAHGMNFNAKGG